MPTTRGCERTSLLSFWWTQEQLSACVGEELRVSFTVVDVKRPILRVARLMDRGIETFIQFGTLLRRADGSFLLHSQVPLRPMFLALVGEVGGRSSQDATW